MINFKRILSRIPPLLLLACTACGVLAPQPTPTPTLPPTATPLPTATATLTLVLTATFTATATQTLTPTITPTNTLVPPPTPAGELVFSDPLDVNDHHWDLWAYLREFAPGRYLQVSNISEQPSFAIMPLDSLVPDVEVIVDTKPVSEASRVFFYGVSCRLNPGNSDQYFLGITPVEGNQYLAGIVKFKNKEALIIAPATTIELMPSLTGFGATLHVMCSGNTFKILGANGQVITATDDEYPNGLTALTVYAPYGVIERVGFNDLFVYRAP